MDTLERLLADATARVSQRYQSEADALRAEESKMIMQAVRDKVALPDHYWMERYKAEERARTAARLLEAFKL